MIIDKELFKVYEIRQLIVKQPEQFIDLVKKVMFEDGLTQAIKLVKVSGICHCVYGNNTNSGLFNDVVKLLKAANGEDNVDIRRLVNEINVFGELFKDFFSLMSKAGFDTIPEADCVSSFLVASENIVSGVMEYAGGLISCNWDEIKNKYPIAKRPLDLSGAPLDPVKDLMRFSEIYDSYVVYVGEIIKFFIYKKIPFAGSDKVFLKKDLDISARYLQLFDLFNRLKFTYESWMFSDCILKQEGNNIFFSPIDEDEYLSRETSLSRFVHLKNQKSIEYLKVVHTINFQPTTADVFPKGLRSYGEVFAGMLCEELLGSHELKDTVLDVAISVWLRAFTIINEVGKKITSERQIGLKLSVNDWCLLRDKGEWINDFVQGGIEIKEAEIIIDNLIFTRGVDDILDCPFISFEDKILCLPSTITNLDASQSLLSNFCKKGIDISFKGYKFQNDITSLINEAGIVAVNLKESKEGSDYECDVFFKISDDLYFLECKSYIQPREPEEYYQLLSKISEDSEQLARISDYFSFRSETLRKKIDVGEKWQPHKINKIILSKANLGSPLFANGCYVVDESAFVRFFSRECFAIVMGNDRIELNDPNLLGGITNDKLINYIQDPPQIKLIKNNYAKVERRLKMSNYVFNFVEFNEKMPLFGFYNEKKTKK